MKIKGIFLTAILAAVFCFNSTVSAYDFSLVVGQSRSFTEYNVHASWFQDDPGNLLPWPVNRIADANDNYASVSLVADPGHAAMAYAKTGVKYDLQLGSYDWNTVKSWPVRVTIRFSYFISAQWTLGTGSGNAWIDLPNAIQYDFIGWETQETGSRANQVTYTWNTTLEQLQSQMSGEIVLEAGCQAHASANFTISNSSSSDITIDSIQIEFQPQAAGLDGQYWFGGLGADVTTYVPWGKRGTVTINGSNWSQEWDDYNGHHAFSSAFFTTVQPDGSVNFNFPTETFNVAWNGNTMIHADTVPDADNRLGIDIMMRKATHVTADDLIGEYRFFGHWLGWDSRWDEVGWGNARFDANETVVNAWTSSDGYTETDTGTWTLDDVNGLGYISGVTNPFLMGEGGIMAVFRPTIDVHPDLGYDFFIKKTDQTITPAQMAGTYLVRFLETGPGGVPYTCGQGTGTLGAGGELSIDAYYSDGEHDAASGSFTIGSGNTILINLHGHVSECIISSDKGLIFGPEYDRPNPPSDYDWIGGLFLIRVPVAVPSVIGDLNGDGDVDSDDLVILASQWLQSPGNPSADIAPPPAGDGIVNLADFALLARHWLEGV